jgi:hypothetical protein
LRQDMHHFCYIKIITQHPYQAYYQPMQQANSLEQFIVPKDPLT